jgi:hypothetical protein
MRSFAQTSRGQARGLAVLAAVLSGGAACDAASRAPDAHARPNAESAEVSVRFDVSPGKPATVQVLAFRAQVSAPPELARPDVLGTVDPLAAAVPAQGCVVRDVDVTTSALAASGASIELVEMTGIGIGLGEGAPLLRPFPRLYPDVAAVVGGIVAEVGAQPLVALPERVSLYSADSELPVAELAVPGVPRITAVDGAAPAPSMRIDPRDGLVVGVAGGAGGLLELRPFGATVSVACGIPMTTPAEATVVVPRPLLAYLMGASARAASRTAVGASLEIARRTRLQQALGATATRISVEVRATTTVELRL